MKITVLRLCLGLACTIGCVSFSGCATGTNTFRISSEPNTADITVNGQYLGKTPKSVPQKWYWFMFISWGDAIYVRLSKDGYKTLERNVEPDAARMYSSGAYERGSEFGWGHTFPITLYLEKLE